MNLLDLYAKITLDTSDYEDGINEASGKASSFLDVLKANLASDAIMSGARKLGEAIGNVGKAAFGGYSDYEQLTGGVETLFKQSSDVVMGYADNAYRSAGLSANEYMTTVTSFSASLLQSLGGDTEKAAKYADMAITDMSDNANKMGTDMSMIQNAYQGFAKQNYTMLDNLKLGYGGTKEEMGRLLKDAQAISGVEYDISSYADIVDAIHVIQTEMGVTGTTAKEASSTLSGSISAMKSAWENLMVGVADEDADMGQLATKFVDTVVTAAGNIIPRIGAILSGMVEMVREVAPQVIEAGKGLLASLTNGVVQNIPDMLSRIPEVFTAFLGFITAKLPEVLSKGVEVLNNLVNGVLGAIPDMLSKLPEVFDAFVSFVAKNLPVIMSAGVDILVNLVSGIIKAIPAMVARIPEIITSFIDTIHKNLPGIIRAGYDLLMKLGDGIFDALPGLLEDLPEIGANILEAMAKALAGIVDIGADIVRGLWEGITSMGSWLGGKVTGFFDGLFDDVKENEEIHSPSKKWAYIGKNDALGFGAGWLDGLESVEKNVTSGLDFGVETVSAPAQTAQTAVDNGPREIVLNITSELDGAVIARKTHRYNLRENNLQGGSLVEVYG